MPPLSMGLPGSRLMRVSNFHSINEVYKPQSLRIYHNNDDCGLGRNVPMDERRSGSGGYELCDRCAELTGDAIRITVRSS